MLFRPTTAPVLQMHNIGGRCAVLKAHHHLVDFARIFPHQSFAPGKRQCERGGIEFNGSSAHQERSQNERNRKRTQKEVAATRPHTNDSVVAHHGAVLFAEIPGSTTASRPTDSTTFPTRI